jgi:hypothetical protein
MFLSAQYAWFEPVLIASIVVFVIDLVGNSIGFGNRFLSALMSAILFAVVFGAPCLFRLRQRFDVSDDDAECYRPRSNAKVDPRNAASDLPPRPGCGLRAAPSLDPRRSDFPKRSGECTCGDLQK